MSDIILSIIMPVYGVEKYIEKCLMSIFPQLTCECELIVVDDCSPDHSIEICRRLVRQNTQLPVKIVCREKNGGLSLARNTGIDHASGKYCWFIDSDDYITDGSVKRILSYFKNNRMDLICFDHSRVNVQDDILFISKSIPALISLNYENDKIDVIGMYLRNLYGFEVWRKVFSLEIIKNNNIRFEPNKEVFAEDICFFLYYINHCKNMEVVNENNYCYLVRPNSIMGTKAIKLNEMINLAKKENNYPSRIKTFDYMRFVLPRLIQIELSPLLENSVDIYNYIYDKKTMLDVCRDRWKGLYKRVSLYGRKEALQQIFLLSYINKELNHNNSNIERKICIFLGGIRCE